MLDLGCMENCVNARSWMYVWRIVLMLDLGCMENCVNARSGMYGELC